MTDEVVERVRAAAAREWPDVQEGPDPMVSVRRSDLRALLSSLAEKEARVGELEGERDEAFLLTLCDLVSTHLEAGYLSTKVRLELIERARRAASLAGAQTGEGEKG